MKETKGTWLCPQDGTIMLEMPKQEMAYCIMCDHSLIPIDYKPAVCPVCMGTTLTYSKTTYLCLNFNCASHYIEKNFNTQEEEDIEYYHVIVNTVKTFNKEIKSMVGATIIRGKTSEIKPKINILEDYRNFYYAWMIRYLIHDCEINNKPYKDLIDLYNNYINSSKINKLAGQRLEELENKLIVK